jgi:hypothetical protein
LWELVFHDCVVTTWYWGDANDWLIQMDPDNAPKRQAFNILYGTMPMLYANKEGSWHADRDLFLRTCRNTTWLHRAVAGRELISHEFVTADHAVQRTRFDGGTEVLVNFGASPCNVKVAGRDRLLPRFGFAACGPDIEQSLEQIDGRAVTSIRAGGFRYSEPPKQVVR